MSKNNAMELGRRIRDFWKGIFGKPELQASYMKCCSCGCRYPLLHVYGNRYVCRGCVEADGKYWYM